MQIDWVCNEEEGALGWPSAFWSEQMPGFPGVLFTEIGDKGI